MIEYFKASWIHDLEDQPILFYSELDNDRYEIRKVEIYKDNNFGLADTSFEFGGAALGTMSVPSIEEINSQPEFLAQVISKGEFEEIWTAYRTLQKSKSIMDVLRKNGRLIFNPSNTPAEGIVFLYANWSESRIYIKYLIELLEDFPQLDLFVYDIDEDGVKNIMTTYNVISHGFGETFWLFEGRIISKILNYKESGKAAIEYTKSLNALVSR